MASNSKSRGHHVYKQKHMIPVPVVHVSPEIANAIRRRDGIGGVDYWNHVSGGGRGFVYRPVRRVTVEEAFPRLSANGIDKPSKSSKIFKSSKNPEIKKSKSMDVESKEFYPDPSRNYRVYNAKIRYNVDKDVTSSTNLGLKSSKADKKIPSKQNRHVIQQRISNASEAIPNGTSPRLQPNGHPEGLPSYRVISSGKDSISKQRQPTWSEMTHLTVIGSLSKFPEAAFQKVGMNHTFRIPRPKATISRNNSLIRENLTASKKRGVTFGQDKVYEYTPQEPLNQYPIHEELI